MIDHIAVAVRDLSAAKPFYPALLAPLGPTTRVLKFRVAWAAGNRIDPRITRVGQILSLTGIDELPQLVNVLLGELSIVERRNVRRWAASIC
jgi:catechol 2,3-dioxygenase-like lactoylglutathione lyase family enzyme